MTGDFTSLAETESLIAWWREAGVDTIVGDAPHDWLGQAPAIVDQMPAPPAATPFPPTLDAFLAWLSDGDDVPEMLWGGPRILPSGNRAADLMIVADVPDPADAGSATLFAGETGRLFDRMLAAIGRDRASIWLAPLATVRPPGGMTDPTTRDRLEAMMRHQLALIGPKMLLLLGNAPSRAFIGMELRDARGEIRDINLESGTIRAVASFAPRTLIERPAAKAEAWRDLQMLMGGLAE